MSNGESQFKTNDSMLKRYGKTLSFIQKHLPEKKIVLDLGVANPLKNPVGRFSPPRNGMPRQEE